MDPYAPNSELDDGSDEVGKRLNIIVLNSLFGLTHNEQTRC